MEDEQRLKERVELSLDSRQVFFLFIASAAVVSLVFALGVVVGKRLVTTETDRQVPTDPLALLDQMGASDPGDEELTFHDKLSRPESAARADATIGGDARATKTPSRLPDPPSPPPPVEPAAKPKKRPPKHGGKPPTQIAHAVPPDREARRDRDPQPGPEPKPAPVEKKNAHAKAKRLQGDAPAGDEDPAGGTQSKGTYTLQLSSFQDRSEAERFMHKLRSAGLAPHIVPARIPERGLWYRVRLGSYDSWKEALAAKKKFEQTQQVIAYVARN